MTVTVRDCVVDASVGIKLCVAEALSDKVDALFSRAALDPPARLLVPDLFYVECANILWKHVRRSGHPADKARRDMQKLRDLHLHRVPTADLADDAPIREYPRPGSPSTRPAAPSSGGSSGSET
jgi:predicted nucleic acid-binding protein